VHNDPKLFARTIIQSSRRRNNGSLSCLAGKTLLSIE
jgi:hypothetical protein